MYENNLNLPEQETNVFLVPSGFRRNPENGSLEVDSEYVSKLEQKVEAERQKPEEQRSASHKQDQEEYHLLSFFDKSSHTLYRGSDIKSKVTWAMKLQEFSQKLSELGQDDQKSIDNLHDEYHVAPGEGNSPGTFATQLRELGIYDKQELNAVGSCNL